MVASGDALAVALAVALTHATIHTPALFLLYHKKLAITWSLFSNDKSSQRNATKKEALISSFPSFSSKK